MRKFLYSPGYGAGWSSWIVGPTSEPSAAEEFALFYQPLIDAIEGDQSTFLAALEQFKADFEARFGDEPYCGGAEDLRVGECPDNDKFRITEYDGSESYELLSMAQCRFH